MSGGRPYMLFRPNDHEGELVFRWWGGEYIEVNFVGGETPVEVINVWDHEQGRARISTLDEFAAVCRAWNDAEPPFDDEEVDR